MQTGGRGRQGRLWTSPSGNLYASTLVRLRAGDPPAATLALVAAVALEEVVRAWLHAPEGDERLTIKWPNDLLLDGAKLSGILLEREGDAIVIGFGVNLASFPHGLDRPVTSVEAATGMAPDPAEFLTDLAPAFARALVEWRGFGLAIIRGRWLHAAHPLGAPLTARLGDGEEIEGLFAGLDEDGALLLRTGAALHTVHAGDVFLL